MKKHVVNFKSPIRHKLVIIGILLCSIFVAGATLAYLIDSTSPVINTFEPAHVDSHVNDDYTVTNKGDIPAYIRASVTFNWVVDDSEARNNTVYYVEGSTLPTIETLGNGWSKTGDYYYYREAVPAEEATATPIWTTLSDYTVPEGFKLEIVVISDAIQAEGSSGTWSNN